MHGWREVLWLYLQRVRHNGCAGVEQVLRSVVHSWQQPHAQHTAASATILQHQPDAQQKTACCRVTTPSMSPQARLRVASSAIWILSSDCIVLRLQPMKCARWSSPYGLRVSEVEL